MRCLIGSQSPFERGLALETWSCVWHWLRQCLCLTERVTRALAESVAHGEDLLCLRAPRQSLRIVWATRGVCAGLKGCTWALAESVAHGEDLLCLTAPRQFGELSGPT